MTKEYEYASVDDLLIDDVTDNTVDVTLTTGGVVKVRGMSRMELMLTRKGGVDDPAEIERRMLSFCMIYPKMSINQVKAWQEATAPMVIAPVTEAVRRLSGLGDDADKSDVPELRGES